MHAHTYKIHNKYRIITTQYTIIALYGAETWASWAVDQKHLESFEMWCWRRKEKISWTDHVRNGEVLLRVKKQRNILHEIIKWKANWIGHICVETAFYNGLLKER